MPIVYGLAVGQDGVTNKKEGAGLGLRVFQMGRILNSILEPVEIS